MTSAANKNNLRKIGLEILPNAVWGTHFCQFYETKEDLLEILVPYFKAGLENNEFCMWITAQPLLAKEAKEAMSKALPDFQKYEKKGQIEIIPHDEWYTKGGSFNSDQVLNGWVSKLNTALRNGFDGLRLTGNTFWIEKKDWKAFAEYEETVNNVIGRYRMLAICTYSLEKCGAPEIIDVVQTHQFAMIKHDKQWRIVESTERLKAEDALRQREEKYRSLFDNMSEAFALIEPIKNSEGKTYDYRFLEVNSSWEKIFDLAKEKVINKKVLEINPDIESYWIENFGKVLDSGQPIHFENYNGRLNKWLDIYANPVGSKTVAAIISDITQRKKAEESLRQEKNFSEKILESIPDGMSIVDENARIIHLNKSFQNIFGKDVLGKKCYEIFKDDRKQCDLCPIKESVKIGETKIIEISGVAGGRTFSISHTGILIDGKRHILEFFKDMTERKEKEEKIQTLIKSLQQERDKREDLLTRIAKERDVLDALMRNTKAQLAYMDKKFNFIAANAAYCQGSGKTEEELIGKNYFRFFPNKENELIFKKVIETAEPIEFSAKPFIFPDRSWIGVTYWDWTITPVKDVTGQAFGLVLSMVDVTERIKNEKKLANYNYKLEQLAEDLEKFKLAVENVHEHIVITDENGIILYSNAGAEQITGYSREESLGKKPSLWGGQMTKEFYEKFWRVIKIEKNPFIGEFTNKRKNGQRYIANAMVIPILDNQNNIRFFVGVERDVTEEKELDRAKTEFISLAAHQLRTPIATISLTAEMLMRGLTGEINKDTQKYLESIMEHVGKMTEMIETFLNVSRIELGTFEIKPRPCDLLEVIEENIEGVMPLAQYKKIKIKKMLPANLPTLNIDPKIMRMVLENIFSNAIKYTLENGFIEVAALNQDQEIIIKVSDNGIGIPENQQSQIFQKMFRADNVINTKVEGVGLGLHLVKTLLEQSGGRVWFESKERKGTTFYVSLPIGGMKEKKRNS